MGDMPGDMRHRVTIQVATRADDSGGGGEESWANISGTPTRWARVQQVSDSETVKSLALSQDNIYKVRIYYDAALAFPGTSRYRFQWESKVLHMMGSANPDGKKQYLEITCRSGQAVAS